MPTSWPKDDATLSSHGLLRFMTLPSQQPHTGIDSSAWSTHQLSTKEILVFCFLAWRGVPGVTTTPFSSTASCLEAFFGSVSQKRTLSSFHLYCLPCSSTFYHNTRTLCGSVKHTFRDEHDGSISFSSPNQRLTNEGLRREWVLCFEGLGALCLVGNVFSSSAFIYPLQLLEKLSLARSLMLGELF